MFVFGWNQFIEFAEYGDLKVDPSGTTRQDRVNGVNQAFAGINHARVHSATTESAILQFPAHVSEFVPKDEKVDSVERGQGCVRKNLFGRGSADDDQLPSRFCKPRRQVL